jgi:hypothetical protein
MLHAASGEVDMEHLKYIWQRGCIGFKLFRSVKQKYFERITFPNHSGDFLIVPNFLTPRQVFQMAWCTLHFLRQVFHSRSKAALRLAWAGRPGAGEHQAR